MIFRTRANRERLPQASGHGARAAAWGAGAPAGAIVAGSNARAARRSASLLLALLLASCATRPAAPKPDIRIVDLMPLYWSFAERAAKEPVDAEPAMFRDLVVKARPDVYSADVLRLEPGSDAGAQIMARYPSHAQWVAPARATMKQLSDEIAAKGDPMVARFLNEFPDFAWRGDIYFIESVGLFDIVRRNVSGRDSIVFGVDVLARVFGPGATIEAQVDRELFHLYEDQLLTKVWVPRAPVWARMWREGLATYAVKKMNPDVTPRQLFGLPESTPSRVRGSLRPLAAELAERLDSTTDEDSNRYFAGGGGTATPPARSGFYIGYLVAAELGKSHSLRELAHMDAEQARQAVASELRKLAAD